MKRAIRLGIVCAAIPVALLAIEARAQTPPPYNPYPSGILPANFGFGDS